MKNIIFLIEKFKLNNSEYIKGFLNYKLLKKNDIYKDNVKCLRSKCLRIENDHFIINDKYFSDKEEKIILKDNIIIIIKNLPNIEILKLLKKNNNYIIHELLDIFYSKIKTYEEYFNIYLSIKSNNNSNILINNNLIDKIIVNSFHMKNILNNYYDNIDVIYHHFDDRINNNNVININPHYFGFKKIDLSNEIINQYNIRICRNIPRYLNNAFLIFFLCIYFKKNILFDNYTSTKLATALATNSIFVCNKIPIFVELLGFNYDYYINNINDLGVIINKAKNTLNNKEKYKKYLEKVKPIKEKLLQEKLLQEYLKIFSKIN